MPFNSLFFGDAGGEAAAAVTGDDLPLLTPMGESGGVAGLLPAGLFGDIDDRGEVEVGAGGDDSAGDDVERVFGVIGWKAEPDGGEAEPAVLGDVEGIGYGENRWDELPPDDEPPEPLAPLNLSAKLRLAA